MMNDSMINSWDLHFVVHIIAKCNMYFFLSPRGFNDTLLHPDVVFTEECDITPLHKAFIYAPPWSLPEKIG